MSFAATRVGVVPYIFMRRARTLGSKYCCRVSETNEQQGLRLSKRTPGPRSES